MAVTVTQKQSWFSKIGDSLKGIIFGLLIFVVAFPLLFWNEGRAVRRHKTLTEGSDSVVSVSSESVDPENEGKLVHLSGEATTADVLVDPEFNISTSVIKYKRTVEMYQWIEDSESESDDNLGGSTETTTTYTYSKGWSESLINSSSFQESGHNNPTSMLYDSYSQVATAVSVGDFEISESLINSISNYSNYNVTEEDLAELSINNAQVSSGGYYIGNSPTNPEIGDLRIKFEVVKPTVVSVIAKQSGNVLSKFSTDTGDLELLELGSVSADEMFESAIQGNKMVTWLIRVGGFFLMFLGLSMVLRPISVVGGVVPFIGKLVGAVTGLLAGVIAFGLSLIVIAIAWIVYRPVLGVILLVVSIAIFGLGFSLIKKKNQK